MTGMAERIVRPGFAANSDTSSLHVPEDDRASLGRRCLAYLVDSVLLFGVCMAFGAAAFLVILLMVVLATSIPCLRLRRLDPAEVLRMD